MHAAASTRLLLHQKSKMAPTKPEIVIIPALYQIDTQFQRQKIFVSTTAIKTLHVAIVSSTQLHRKSDMAAVKPEVVIIPALYPLDMKFSLI